MDRPGISLEEWYPLVEPVVPTPRTVWRKGLDLMPLAYGPEADPDGRLMAEFEAVCSWVKGSQDWPIFLRTGLTSGKHDWLETCYLDAPEKIAAHVSALCEFSAIADLLGLPADVWVVREFLSTVAPFLAFGGMPVTRERRYFVRDGEILGHHPCWPPDSILSPSVRDWRKRLKELNRETPAEIEELTDLSLRVSAVVPGAWSVDWLWSDGWYLTDMAHAEASYVWEDYPSAPKLPRRGE